MAHSVRLLQLIRVRTTPTSLALILPPSRIPLSRNFDPLRSLSKSFQSAAALGSRSSISNWKYYLQRCLHVGKSYTSGHEFRMGRLFGVSALLGSFFIRPRFAHCMNGYAPSLDDHSRDLLGKSETEEDPHAFLMLIKKLMVPIALLLIVWMNWNYPVVLAVKVIITLLSTKPSPFSVYVFIEQLQRQYKGQHPLLHKFKSLYAKKVDVEDYSFFCLARVEIGDQKYTLLGILGGWWVFELTSLQDSLSSFRHKLREILETAVSSEV